MTRGVWFVAGAGAGVYAMVKARRVAETFTPEGLRDRMAGLGVGAHLFAQEVRTGMSAKESELRGRLGWTVEGPPQLASSSVPADVQPLHRPRAAAAEAQPLVPLEPVETENH